MTNMRTTINIISSTLSDTQIDMYEAASESFKTTFQHGCFLVMIEDYERGIGLFHDAILINPQRPPSMVKLCDSC